MKIKKKYIGLFTAVLLILNVCVFGAICASAHSALLNVEYDDCVDDEYDDGVDEMWYAFGETDTLMHLSQEDLTIKYYFSNSSKDGLHAWTSNGVSITLAQEIKNAYATSMKKWNNVYFYT